MINAMTTSGSGWGGWESTAYSNEYHTGDCERVIDNSGSYDEGSFGFQTILHELGHAMGLQHPWEGGVTLDTAIDDQWHTVMTYRSAWPHTGQLGSLDVAAMQAQYGSVATTADWAAGNDRLYGGDGRDTLTGGSSDDLLFGGKGRDGLDGRDSADVLRGGTGADRLYGGGAAGPVLVGPVLAAMFGWPVPGPAERLMQDAV